ncbi:MAG: 30S ribosomal protein S3 [Limnochordaceae bacterium]|nr:30S ribosomal protein S3 [Limnochordaceae bacterium]
MGHKVHPQGLRLGIIRDWDAHWYAGRKELAALLHEDLKLRRYIKERFFSAGVSRVEIERAGDRLRVTIHTARPGMVIGKGGQEVELLRKDLESRTGRHVQVNIVEVKNADVDAQLVAENIAYQLERRVAFRRAMKQAAQRTMRAGAQGVKIMISGRIGGAEIARTEWTAEGKIPLHTLRADVDYGFAEAKTTYGRLGVKVWIYKGEVLPERAAVAAGTEAQ